MTRTPAFLRPVALAAALAAGAGPAFTQNLDLVVSSSDEDLKSALNAASVLRAAFQDEERGPAELVAAAKAEYARLLTALYSEGYYGGVINVFVDGREAADLSPLSAPSGIGRIVVNVQPGPQFVFSEARIDPLSPETDLPEEFAVGEPAAASIIGDAANAGIDGWRNLGFARADIASEDITANHAANTLSARIGISTGPRLRFGRPVITGNERVRTERIRTIAGIPEGEIYDPEELEQATKRLRRTEAFRSITVSDAETLAADGSLPIDIAVVEEKRRRLGVGLEYSSVEGLTFTTFWLHRNLLGGAERLRFDFDVTNIGATEEDNGIDYALTGFFRRPATFTPDTNLLINGAIESEDEPGYKSDSLTFGVGLERIFSERLTGTVGVALRAGQVEDAFGEREFSLVSLPVSLTYNTRDTDLDATEGVYIKADVSPFVGISDIDSGALTEVDARAYYGFGAQDRVVLAGRAQLGSLTGPDIDSAPPDYLFFAGGGGSVRGHPFQTLGTDEIDDTVIGGRSYVALSAEVRTKVTDKIGIVGFYDTGYVGEEEFPDGSGETISGAGLGLRYATGIGPIRVDVATPVGDTPDEDAAAVQFYIGIGQAF
ncbi:autotransporter assembly complex family protein [Tropicimonas sp. IMCC34011]|uniref:autotransporter assembly complex protein TamA n=1 Tax=Tropicimonas sp. IMCC34011 TaxID=2248759 RepID=UPI001300900D|nr:autotransporter assembly complex family protein [Tropicimonas sp. IMCC34011]